MIRAILTQGVIQPLEPLPTDWVEGRELRVERTEQVPPNLAGEIDSWRQALEEIIAEMPDDPEDARCLQETLAEAHRLAKEQVRRDMGLAG